MAIELIDKIKQKNGGTFKLMDAEDIAFEEHSLTEEIDSVKTQLSQSKQELGSRIDNIITEEIDSVKTQLSQSKQELGSRIDNIITNNNPTDGNSELIDIRVGADGKKYGSAGDAIRSQMKAKANNIQSYVEVPLTMIDGLMNQKNGNIVTVNNYSHFEIDVNANESYRYNGYHISTDFALIVFKNSSNEMVGDYLPNPIISSGKLTDFEFNVPNGAIKMYINTNNTTPSKLEKMTYLALNEEVAKVKDKIGGDEFALNPPCYTKVPLTMIDGLMNQKNGNIVTVNNYSHFEIDVNANESYRYNGYHISTDFALIVFKNSSNEMVGDYLPNPIISSGKLTDFEFNVPNGAIKMYINTNNTTPSKLEKKGYIQLYDEILRLETKIDEVGTVDTPIVYEIISSELEDYNWMNTNAAWTNNPEWYKHKKYSIQENIDVKVRAQGASDILPGVLCFAANGELLASYSANTNQIESFEFTTPKNTTQVVLNGTSSYRPSLSVKKTYSGNGLEINPLFHKKISSNGDSIMYGLGYTGGFLKIIADRNNMILNNIAVSGGTLSDPNNSTVHYIGGTIENMDSDSDYYIVEGGYNDWLYNTNYLGEITQTMTDEVNVATIYGGMEIICRKLLNNFVGKKIGFVITHKILQSAYTDKGKGFTMTDVHDAIIKVLNKYSIPYCDLFNDSCLNTELQEYLKFTNSNDGVHPDELGYCLFYVPKVEAWLKTL